MNHWKYSLVTLNDSCNCTFLVLRIFVRTSDMEYILCLNLIQFNWATYCFSSLLQRLPLVYSFNRSCKKYKKCKNTKCEKTKRKLTVSWFIFLLCHYRLKDTAIIQVMKVMKTSFLSHRPQPFPPKQHVILYIVKHFWRVYSYPPAPPTGAMPCQGREACEPLLPTELWWWELMLMEDNAALLLGRGARLNSTLVLQVGG